MNFNIETYIELQKEFNLFAIKIDVGDSDFVNIVDFVNCGSDKDFIITWEIIDYENLRLHEYKSFNNCRDLNTNDVLYLHIDNFLDFCDSLSRFYNNSLKEFMLDNEVLK